MAIYIDNEFRLETSSDKDRDEIIVNEFSCGDWVRPRVHSIELKLKTAQVGGIAYNNFFEVYYSEKGGKDHAEHQS